MLLSMLHLSKDSHLYRLNSLENLSLLVEFFFGNPQSGEAFDSSP